MTGPEIVEAWRRRLTAMGLPVHGSGPRCVVSRLRLGEAPFPTPDGELRLHEVVFASVGADRIKCLRPRPLFQLPMLRVADCRDAGALEERIREAWQRHQADLARTGDWLQRLGVATRVLEQGSLLGFALDPEGEVLVTGMRPRELLLPSRGPLSGAPLERAEDRSFAVPPGIDSAQDLSIALEARLEELARLQRRLQSEPEADAEAEAEAETAVEEEPAAPPGPGPRRRVVVVGPVLGGDPALIDSLSLRGYEPLLARSETEALRHFSRTSPELILADARLGRSEGIDLIPAVRRLVGIEEIPVLLVDGQRNEGRRDAARRAGAAGYLTQPVQMQRIERQLEKIVLRPRRRRFTRYPRRLSASVTGARDRVLVSEIGRGGMFLGTDADLRPGSVHGCWVTLPELGRRLQLEAEVVYRREGRDHGLGVRFRAFHGEAEPALIEYLGRIDPHGASAGAR